MAKRVDRGVSAATKQKISDGMKRYHLSRSEEEKRQTNAKRSASAKEYWSHIPPKRTSIEDIMI